MPFRAEERGRSLTAAEELAVSRLKRIVQEAGVVDAGVAEADGDDLVVRFAGSRSFTARRRRHFWIIETEGRDELTVGVTMQIFTEGVVPAIRDRVLVSEDVVERSARMTAKVIAEGRKRARLTIASIGRNQSSRFDCDESFSALGTSDVVRLIAGARCLLEPAGAEDGHSLEAVLAVALGIPVVTHAASTLAAGRKVDEWSADAFLEAVLQPFEQLAPLLPGDEELARWLAQR